MLSVSYVVVKVSVLFEEMFFNKQNKSYRVLCIAQPLGAISIGQ